MHQSGGLGGGDIWETPGGRGHNIPKIKGVLKELVQIRRGNRCMNRGLKAKVTTLKLRVRERKHRQRGQRDVATGRGGDAGPWVPGSQVREVFPGGLITSQRQFKAKSKKTKTKQKTSKNPWKALTF